MTQPTPQAQPNQAPKIHPERQRRVKQALQWFSIAAWVTGVLFLLLCLRMIMQYGFDMNVDYLSWVARVHGFAFVAFLMTSLNLGSKARWSAGTWISTALSGVVPFMSFIVEAKRRKEVKETFQLS
ncbi:DUF3817 domain-containing protein [Corynebacterium fournieri]|uniref:DUF3817 domain-containing protein n=1 Tax=Corynebacterium fournieri TaxID=1852390 RepID=UPI000A2EE79E|nr:DUF3817 domain-containing protein [Corynebacterium fournieri]WJY98185.1 hypothetical protein CFOUR_08940 [Corynebacterium fournieri]